MHLQQLTIHNIASIADATIDFDAPPLATAEVFLITGKTGAGKSTILDCICLALFADTPRLRNTRMEGKTRDGDKDVTISDPTQLMRRNTGEAMVTLTFIGSNGVRYEATWSVQRAFRRPSGNLQGKKWQLTNLDTNETLLKDKDIQQEMKSAIGLDFNQFCRTTMLAQGEFTRFLNSKDEEKAAILEKITGVDVYSKIGRKVYELTSTKEQLWHDARRLTEGIILLKDEEIADLTRQLAELTEEQKKLGAEREENERKIRWQTLEREIAQQVFSAREDFFKAKENIESESNRAEELIVRQWNETIEARGWLKEIADNEKLKAQLATRQEQLRKAFTQLQAGVLWEAEELKRKEQELKSVTSFIESQTAKQAVLQNAQTILAQLKIIVLAKRNIDEENKNSANILRLGTSLKTRHKEATEALAKAEQTFVLQEKLVTELEANLLNANLPTLRKRKEETVAMAMNIAQAIDRLSDLSTARKNHESARLSLEKQTAQIAELSKQAETLAAQFREAEIKRDTSKEIYEKQRESVDRWAKGMRAKLQVGDLCPVCRQTITCLPDEMEIDQLYISAEKVWMEAENALETLLQNKNRLAAEINSQTRVYNEAKSAFDRDESVKTCEARAVESCRKCGIETIGEDSPARLTKLLDEANATKEKIDAEIKSAEEIECNLTKQRTALETLRKAKETAKQMVDDIAKQILDNEGKVKASEHLVQSKKEEIAMAEDAVAELIDEKLWENNWKTQTTEFGIELKKAVERYNGQLQEQQQLSAALQICRATCKSIGEATNAILAQMPDWKGQSIGYPSKQDNLIESLNRVRSEVKSSEDQMISADENRARAEEKLSRYLEQRTDISRQRLFTLNEISSDDITRRNAMLTNLRNAVIEKKSALDQLLKQQQENAANKPSMSDEDTFFSLSERKFILEKQINELGERRGAINLNLKQDAENKARKSTLLAEEEMRKQDFLQWSRLNQLIGDATGSKFRKIAQSYVLGSLIHAANSYMRTLTDRYTLLVEPGTFVISIEDAYQGFARRAASTISGGESFLVSLSLALALSDIGHRLAVDILFIDEGFGTLSGEPLHAAIATLRSLHTRSGRHVGIISHIEELRERIPVQIRVEQESANASSHIHVGTISAFAKD